MITTIEFLRVFAFSQLLLLGILISLKPKVSGRKWFIAACLSVSAYLILPIIYKYLGDSPLVHIGLFIAVCIPVFLWLMCFDLLEDEIKPHFAVYIIFAIYIALDFSRVFVFSCTGDCNLAFSEQLLFFWFPSAVKLLIVLHIIVITVRGYAADLLVERRRVRPIIILAFGLITAGVIIAEVLTDNQEPLWLEMVGAIVFALSAFAFNLYLLQLNPQFNSSNSRQKNVITEFPDDNARNKQLLNKLDTLMNEEREYAKHGLRLADIARSLDLPEYKTRVLINQELGFKNVNQFLNHYRIAEAAHRIQTDDRTLPILTIALDVGFTSLTSFNKVFKQLKDMTPSEYRNKSDPN